MKISSSRLSSRWVYSFPLNLINQSTREATLEVSSILSASSSLALWSTHFLVTHFHLLTFARAGNVVLAASLCMFMCNLRFYVFNFQSTFVCTALNHNQRRPQAFFFFFICTIRRQPNEPWANKVRKKSSPWSCENKKGACSNRTVMYIFLLLFFLNEGQKLLKEHKGERGKCLEDSAGLECCIVSESLPELIRFLSVHFSSAGQKWDCGVIRSGENK